MCIENQEVYQGKYNYDLSNEEVMYLAIHINKITEDERNKK